MSGQWSSEMKFMTVVATAQMDAEEKSHYCRENGLYIEQIEEWKAACIAGTMSSQEQKKQARVEAKQDKKRIKNLEKELRRKEKALAETAALSALSEWERKQNYLRVLEPFIIEQLIYQTKGRPKKDAVGTIAYKITGKLFTCLKQKQI